MIQSSGSMHQTEGASSHPSHMMDAWIKRGTQLQYHIPACCIWPAYSGGAKEGVVVILDRNGATTPHEGMSVQTSVLSR
jgi:hypothetical protein